RSCIQDRHHRIFGLLSGVRGLASRGAVRRQASALGGAEYGNAIAHDLFPRCHSGGRAAVVRGGRIGLGAAFGVLVGAGVVGSKAGLGTIISYGEEWVRFDLMFAGIVCFAVLGFVSDRLLLAVRSRLLKGQMIGTEEEVVR